jgi:hypothetical protein
MIEISSRLARLLNRACATNSGFLDALAIIRQEMGVSNEMVYGVSGKTARVWQHREAECRQHFRAPILYCTVKARTGERWKIWDNPKALAATIASGGPRVEAALNAKGFSRRKVRDMARGDAGPIQCMAAAFALSQMDGVVRANRLVSWARIAMMCENDRWFISRVERFAYRYHYQELAEVMGVDDATLAAWRDGRMLPAPMDRATPLLSAWLDLNNEPPLTSKNVKADVGWALKRCPLPLLASRMGEKEHTIAAIAEGREKLRGIEAAHFCHKAQAASLRWVDATMRRWVHSPENMLAAEWRVEDALEKKYV